MFLNYIIILFVIYLCPCREVAGSADQNPTVTSFRSKETEEEEKYI